MTTRTPIKPHRADWRDPNQYPEFGSKDYERLMWEFIRRNHDYADLMTVLSRLGSDEYQDGIKESSDTVLDGLECVPKAKEGETASEYYERTKKRKKRGRILSPKSQVESRWYMQPVELLLPDTEFDPYLMNFVPHGVAMRAPKSEAVATFSLPLYPDEIAFRFRLDVTFQKQLRDVRDRFNSAREEAGYGKHTKEPNLDFAHFWLRAIDAHHALVMAPARRKKEPGKWQEVFRAHLEQELEPKLKKRAKLNDHKPEGWRITATSYIGDRKFVALLYKRKKTIADPLKVVHRMVKSPQVAAAKEGRIAMR